MDEDRYADLRGRLDAAEVVLRTLFDHVRFEEGAEARLKAEILRFANGMRTEARGNPLSLAQADAMDRYAAALRSG